MNILPGYMLKVTSYDEGFNRFENVVLHGLSKQDVRFYLAFLTPFANKTLGRGLYGGESINAYPKAPIHCLEDAFCNFPPSDPTLHRECFDAIMNSEANPEQDYAFDLIVGLIGTWNEGYNYRSFSCHRVHHVPKECLDVTNEFRP